MRTADVVGTVGADAAVAVQAARTPPGQIATLILPSDTSWNEGGVVAERAAGAADAARPTPHRSRNAAGILRRGEPTLIVLGGEAVRAERAGRAAHRIAAATGARLIAQAPTRASRAAAGACRSIACPTWSTPR